VKNPAPSIVAAGICAPWAKPSNRTEEQQLGLFADRTSAVTLRANQLCLYFSNTISIMT
jgi:hypothetical protein